MDNNFQKIIAWQKAHEFVLAVYAKAEKFPIHERHGLWSQFTRAAVSVASNIVEGSRKLSKADKLRFMNISQGSLEECRYYIILSRDLNYISNEDFEQLNYLAKGASWYLNSYIEGIIKNSGVQED